MDITLSTVRRVLMPVFGINSMITNYVARVEPDDNIPTACIDGHKLMRYNPQFIKDNVRSPEDLFCLITHEMLHSALYHILTTPDEQMHVAADAIINSMITLGFPNESGRGSLFRKYYKNPKGIEQLLRPDSPAMDKGRFRHLYRVLWSTPGADENYPKQTKQGITYSRPVSTGDVAGTLRMLWGNSRPPKRGLLGGHESLNQGKAQRLPKDVTGALASAMEKALDRGSSNGGGGAGFSSSLMKIFQEILETAKSLDQKLMERFSDQQKVTKFLELERAVYSTMTPFPTTISKRDQLLLAAGAHTGYFRVSPLVQEEREARRKRATVYLDVSGSVYSDLPEILGVIRNIKQYVAAIHLFSNKCVEARWEDLERGELDTTGGTDFDCVAKKMLEVKNDKAIVITDGIAHMDEKLQIDLTAAGIEILTVLFGGLSQEPIFKNWGPVVKLENVVV